MIKISVLIAVYNTESFLPKCLDSLREQRLRDFQVICVDDCSTDNSLAILKEYEAKDDRFTVISLDKNMGQAHARNIALQKAEGEYVMFLDSDDWIAPDAMSEAYRVFRENEKTDCILFSLRYVYQDGREADYPMEKFDVKEGKTAFKDSLVWKIHGVYILRTDIHKRFPYDESCRAYSDDNTTRLHYLNSREVRLCEGVYFYRQNPNSVTHAVSIKRFDYIYANVSMKRQLVELGVEKELIDLYENVRWMILIDMYMFYFKYRSRLGKRERTIGLGRIKRVWRGIETESLKDKRKFGYIPFRGMWPLFVVQEEIYFFLRKLAGRF